MEHFIDFLLFEMSNPVAVALACIFGLWLGGMTVAILVKLPKKSYTDSLLRSNQKLREQKEVAIKDAAYWKKQAEEISDAAQQKSRHS